MLVLDNWVWELEELLKQLKLKKQLYFESTNHNHCPAPEEFKISGNPIRSKSKSKTKYLYLEQLKYLKLQLYKKSHEFRRRRDNDADCYSDSDVHSRRRRRPRRPSRVDPAIAMSFSKISRCPCRVCVWLSNSHKFDIKNPRGNKNTFDKSMELSKKSDKSELGVGARVRAAAGGVGEANSTSQTLVQNTPSSSSKSGSVSGGNDMDRGSSIDNPGEGGGGGGSDSGGDGGGKAEICVLCPTPVEITLSEYGETHHTQIMCGSNPEEFKAALNWLRSTKMNRKLKGEGRVCKECSCALIKAHKATLQILQFGRDHPSLNCTKTAPQPPTLMDVDKDKPTDKKCWNCSSNQAKVNFQASCSISISTFIETGTSSSSPQTLFDVLQFLRRILKLPLIPLGLSTPTTTTTATPTSTPNAQPTRVIVATQMIMLCCPSCQETFQNVGKLLHIVAEFQRRIQFKYSQPAQIQDVPAGVTTTTTTHGHVNVTKRKQPQPTPSDKVEPMHSEMKKFKSSTTANQNHVELSPNKNKQLDTSSSKVGVGVVGVERERENGVDLEVEVVDIAGGDGDGDAADDNGGNSYNSDADPGQSKQIESQVEIETKKSVTLRNCILCLETSLKYNIDKPQEYKDALTWLNTTEMNERLKSLPLNIQSQARKGKGYGRICRSCGCWIIKAHKAFQSMLQLGKELESKSNGSFKFNSIKASPEPPLLDQEVQQAENKKILKCWNCLKSPVKTHFGKKAGPLVTGYSLFGVLQFLRKVMELPLIATAPESMHCCISCRRIFQKGERLLNTLMQFQTRIGFTHPDPQLTQRQLSIAINKQTHVGAQGHGENQKDFYHFDFGAQSSESRRKETRIRRINCPNGVLLLKEVEVELVDSAVQTPIPSNDRDHDAEAKFMLSEVKKLVDRELHTFTEQSGLKSIHSGRKSSKNKEKDQPNINKPKRMEEFDFGKLRDFLREKCPTIYQLFRKLDHSSDGTVKLKKRKVMPWKLAKKMKKPGKASPDQDQDDEQEEEDEDGISEKCMIALAILAFDRNKLCNLLQRLIGVELISRISKMQHLLLSRLGICVSRVITRREAKIGNPDSKDQDIQDQGNDQYQDDPDPEIEEVEIQSDASDSDAEAEAEQEQAIQGLLRLKTPPKTKTSPRPRARARARQRHSKF